MANKKTKKKQDQSSQTSDSNDARFQEPNGTWDVNTDYFRLDGSSSAEVRKKWCSSFNSKKNLRARLFCISTKAGGVGINLVAANRVIIFYATWNPSNDVQSIFRAYRYVQFTFYFLTRLVIFLLVFLIYQIWPKETMLRLSFPRTGHHGKENLRSTSNMLHSLLK